MYRALVAFLFLNACATVAHAPTPSTEATVWVRSHDQVGALCGIASAGALQNAEACANTQVIIMPDPCLYQEHYAEVFCHELRHFNGWPHNHPEE